MRNQAAAFYGPLLFALQSLLIGTEAYPASSDPPLKIGPLLGGSLNPNPTPTILVDASKHGLSPSLAVVKDRLLAAWADFDSQGVTQIRVKEWTGQKWSPLGKSLNDDKSRRGFEPVITAYQDTVYIAWTELSRKMVPQIRVGRWSGSEWEMIGKSLNLDPGLPAVSPSLAADDTGLYVAWIENNRSRTPQLHVKKRIGEDWTLLGDSVNRDPALDAGQPSLALIDKTPYVAWTELTDQGRLQIHISRWNETAWEPVGGALNPIASTDGVSPSLVDYLGMPHIAWVELQREGGARLHVSQWSDEKWTAHSEDLNQSASQHVSSPVLASNGKSLYLGWAEIGSQGFLQVRVKQWNGEGWIGPESGIHVDSRRAAGTPALVVKGQIPFIGWKEADERGLYQVYVRQLQE
jgi:hypothetical protein